MPANNVWGHFGGHLSKWIRIEGASVLTDVKIRQAKPKDKAYKLSDGRGGYIEASTNGGKCK